MNNKSILISVLCGTNDGNLVIFSSANGFRAQTHFRGNYGLRAITTSSLVTCILTNQNSAQVIFKDINSVAIELKNQTPDSEWMNLVLLQSTENNAQVSFYLFLIKLSNLLLKDTFYFLLILGFGFESIHSF